MAKRYLDSHGRSKLDDAEYLESKPTKCMAALIACTVVGAHAQKKDGSKTHALVVEKYKERGQRLEETEDQVQSW